MLVSRFCSAACVLIALFAALFSPPAFAQTPPIPVNPPPANPAPMPPSPLNPAPNTAPNQIPAPVTNGLPQQITVPPPPQVAPYLPFPNLPVVPLDEINDGVGIAQQMTRTRNVQGRVLWIDATANLDKVNTTPKIAALVSKIKSVGF